MLTSHEKARYDRHLQLPEVGTEGQLRLKQARVLVIGAGGLGCPVLQYLCAAGVGHLGIVDFDTVETSNLQRQVLYGSSTLGQNKAQAAKARLDDLNPEISITAHPFRLDSDKAAELIEAYDVIVDTSDNYATRYLVNDRCVAADKPMVFGAIYRYEGQVAVFNHQNGPTYRCAFPSELTAGEGQNCQEAGVLGVLPGLIGLMQANETIKLILGIGELLSGKMLIYNALRNEINVMRIQRSNQVLMENTDINTQDQQGCQCGCSSEGAPAVRMVSASDLNDWITAVPEEIFLIDVREPGESPSAPFAHFQNIPLADIEESSDRVPKNMPVVLFCRSGKRSAMALERLLAVDSFKNLYSLEGGLQQWFTSFNPVPQEG